MILETSPMVEMKCLCGGKYMLVPDDEVTELPPSFTARYFHCKTCDGYDWLTPEEFGVDTWDEVFLT